MLLTLAIFGFGASAKSQVANGTKVPDFELKDQDGRNFKLSDALAKGPVVVYFYPKDDTPGCTKEACSFRDSFEQFKDEGVQVVGISADDVASHKKFAEKYKLPFTLLSDEDNKVRKLFGVPKTMMMPGRVTYVLDKNGVVVHQFNSMTKAEQHVEEAIAAVKKM
ncbi:peroxiredoxin [Chitinophaga cymbidii]|uniref:thioredoxin-dependent peroxiredoxin n=2 Tax=Chitinophaga cymbidii TaxID=1096750 RepID=A0A512RSE9_9BACT|nr:peroxiredoxin [Chitinophaga cymbidii]